MKCRAQLQLELPLPGDIEIPDVADCYVGQAPKIVGIPVF